MGDSRNMEPAAATFESDLNLKATELRLGLPGTDSLDPASSSSSSSRGNKRAIGGEERRSKSGPVDNEEEIAHEPPAKAQIVGWPPVRSFMKNTLQTRKMEAETSGIYVKVSMDGAPYLRKIDLKVYKSYPELLKALKDMFKCFSIGKKHIEITSSFFFFFLLLRSCMIEISSYFQVSFQIEKDTMGLNMHSHMKIKMGIGCWLEMSHGICSSLHVRG